MSPSDSLCMSSIQCDKDRCTIALDISVLREYYHLVNI